jgi:3,4-dihydroxy 2-butanone 4-phosphate synthase/GTP cyclohydrolase II
MARVGDLKAFAQKHNMKIGTIVDLIQYRLAHETLVEETGAVDLPAELGNNLKARIFRSRVDQTEHLVIQKGEIDANQPTLVRVHVDNFVRDLFSGLQTQSSVLLESVRLISQEESGLLVLLRGNNRPAGLAAEVAHYTNADESKAVGAMDQRDYGIGAQILRELGVHKIRLLTNKPEKKVGLKAYNLEIVEIVPIDLVRTAHPKGEDNDKRTQSGSGHSSIQ